MPSGGDKFYSCFNNLIDEFLTYDQTVDVVSCWETIFKYGYKNDMIYFDRYPNIQPNGLTPDFTALFNKNYGLIFEVKRTFPRDEVAFKKEIEQLLSYDADLSLKADSSGKMIAPTVHDIVLVVSGIDSNEIFTRLNKVVDESKQFHFENNLILIEYIYQTNRTSRYIFRKFMGENKKFRDESLPPDTRLEYILGDQAKPFKCYPLHFMKYKVSEVLCNDQPPMLYMAVFLWTKVFYNYLDEEQKIAWGRGNPQKIQTIDINIDGLLGDLNRDYIPNGNIRRKWLTDTVEFLQDAGLASIKSNEQVEIYFRNLTQKIGHRYTHDGGAEQEEIREFGHLIADHYCKNTIETKKAYKKTKTSAKKPKQMSLFSNG